jgi:hypothetical protein
MVRKEYNNSDAVTKRVYGLMGLFVLQFILGMTLNLFVNLPKAHPGTTGGYGSRAIHGYGWALTNGGGIALTIHAWIALGMLAAAIAILVFAIKSRVKSWIIAASIGLVFIISAFINGLNFINLGGHNANSMAMAISYIVAFSTYGIGLYINK